MLPSHFKLIDSLDISFMLLGKLFNEVINDRFIISLHFYIKDDFFTLWNTYFVESKTIIKYYKFEVVKIYIKSYSIMWSKCNYSIKNVAGSRLKIKQCYYLLFHNPFEFLLAFIQIKGNIWCVTTHNKARWIIILEPWKNMQAI